jgi:VCBS repeat-containing protein
VLTNDTDPDSVGNGETRVVSALRTGTEAGSGTAGAVGAALAGTFGSLTLNADGSYTYVVDETNTAVQALRVTGQQLTDVFTYTMQDAGGLSDTGATDTSRSTAATTRRWRWTTRATCSGGGRHGERRRPAANGTGNVLTNDTDPDSVVNGEARTVSALRTGTEAGSGTAGALVGAALAGHPRQPDDERGRQLHLPRSTRPIPAVQALAPVTGQQTHRRVHLHAAGRRRPDRPGATDDSRSTAATMHRWRWTTPPAAVEAGGTANGDGRQRTAAATC